MKRSGRLPEDAGESGYGSRPWRLVKDWGLSGGNWTPPPGASRKPPCDGRDGQELQRIHASPVELTAGMGEIKTEVQKTRDYLSLALRPETMGSLWERFGPSGWRRK
jgi:hypothetical protein